MKKVFLSILIFAFLTLPSLFASKSNYEMVGPFSEKELEPVIIVASCFADDPLENADFSSTVKKTGRKVMVSLKEYQFKSKDHGLVKVVGNIFLEISLPDYSSATAYGDPVQYKINVNSNISYDKSQNNRFKCYLILHFGLKIFILFLFFF